MPMQPDQANFGQTMPSGAVNGDYPNYTIGDWSLQSPQEGCDCHYCTAYKQFMQTPPPPPPPPSPTAPLSFATQNISMSFDEAFPLPKPKKKLAKPEEPVLSGGIKMKTSSEVHQELCKGKVLYLLRGVSGSGKSTLAYLLALAFRKGLGISSAVYEADQAFTIQDANGYSVYLFEQDKLPNAHELCQEKVRKAMATEGLGGIAAIFVANPFLSRQHLVPYQRLAREFGYQVVEIVCKGNFGSPHEIPLDEVRRTKQRFEN